MTPIVLGQKFCYSNLFAIQIFYNGRQSSSSSLSCTRKEIQLYRNFEKLNRQTRRYTKAELVKNGSLQEECHGRPGNVATALCDSDSSAVQELCHGDRPRQRQQRHTRTMSVTAVTATAQGLYHSSDPRRHCRDSCRCVTRWCSVLSNKVQIARKMEVIRVRLH